MRTQGRGYRSRLRILEAAMASFAERGFDATSFQHVASAAGTSVGLVCRHFPSKEHFALALYDRLSDELEAWAEEMPAGTLAERFRATMRCKLALVAPHKRALTALAAQALDPDARTGVLGPMTDVVRSKVVGVIWVAVCGAKDAPSPAEAAQLARLLYGSHLLLLLLFLQERGERARATEEALDLVCGALDARGLVLPLLAGVMGQRIDGLLTRLFDTSRIAAPSTTARIVLDRILRRRRVLPGVEAEPSEATRALHLEQVQAFVDAQEPVHLVLPAFPAKAPNPEKVLGRLPDMGEWLALESLVSLLDDIAEAHRPGAILTICSDGQVFTDAVGITDADVSAYRRRLESMIDELGTERLQVFGLSDAFGPVAPAIARRKLLESYGPSIEEVRGHAKRSASHATQLDGIHRFLFEDLVVLRPELSRSQARKETRERAYEVVCRSEAWGELVAAVFPRALRLSIHPQPDVSQKIGIHLLPTEDAWLTPWHGTAVFDGGGVRLMRRRDAEALGAVVVEDGGLPSHMELGS